MAQNIPNFDATFCGRLPLHQTNLLQPHGVLFVLDAAALDIMQVSDNVPQLLGAAAAAVAGTNFSLYANETSIAALRQYVEEESAEKLTITVTIITGEQPVDCSAQVHRKGPVVFAEVLLPQFARSGVRSFLQAYQEIRQVVARLDQHQTVKGFAETVAKEMRRISGMDKVLVYSFNQEWHGTVIAEEKVPEMDTYLGLRFPASDIPKPARDLYLKNPYRLIPNGRYQPAKLYPLLHPHTNAFSDLSGCDLRSVAGVHLEYMKNMEISASMSVRLVHEGKLWGLVSCHHREPRYFSFEELGLFELLSGIFSARLSLVLHGAESKKAQGLQQQLTDLVPLLDGNNSLHNALRQHAAQVQQLLCADGIAFNFNGHIDALGTVPDSTDLDRLFYWLQVQEPGELLHEPSLPKVFEEAAAFAPTGSGILALPVVPQKGYFLVAFRPEAPEEVAWGGNPHEALQLEGDGKTYHPRNSFQIWKERVQQTARPWDETELHYAGALKNILGNIVLRRLHP